MLSGMKRWVVPEVCRAGSPSQEPCCVIPVGTKEGSSARIHAANLQGDRVKKGRKSACRHSAISLGERVESRVTLVASIVVAGARVGSGCVYHPGGVKGSAKGYRKFKKIQERKDQWAPHPLCHPRILLYREFDASCETRRLPAQKGQTPWPKK